MYIVLHRHWQRWLQRFWQYLYMLINHTAVTGNSVESARFTAVVKYRLSCVFVLSVYSCMDVGKHENTCL